MVLTSAITVNRHGAAASVRPKSEPIFCCQVCLAPAQPDRHRTSDLLWQRPDTESFACSGTTFRESALHLPPLRLRRTLQRRHPQASRASLNGLMFLRQLCKVKILSCFASAFFFPVLVCTFRPFFEDCLWDYLLHCDHRFLAVAWNGFDHNDQSDQEP